MTQEEKAKAYDKAIEKIKYVMEHGVSPTLNKEDLQDIFPELKEPEDEKIRKAQLDYWRSVGGKEWHGVPVQEVIAWLEKQGEQKSTVNFKAKDWYVSKVDGKIHNIYNSEVIFPELKESEDEKIRKELNRAIAVALDYSYFDKKTADKCIAWLEKQKTIDVLDDEEFADNIDSFRKSCDEAYQTGYQAGVNAERKNWLEKQGEKKEINPTLQEKERMDDTFTKMMLKPQVDGFDAELKKSEDEEIRKELAQYLTKSKEIERAGSLHGNFDEWIAWLEKQAHDGKKWIFEDTYNKEKEEIYQDGMDEVIDNPQKYGLEKQREKKPINKVEPKFHEGEWITDGQLICKVLGVTSKSYELHLYNDDYCHFETDVQSVNRRYHLWTIQDAKDGDVLVCNEEILLFKSYSVQDRISLYCWYNGQTNHFHSEEVTDVSLTTRNKICPATKEQRELLFQKMKEAGYEWDEDKKELRKIEK